MRRQSVCAVQGHKQQLARDLSRYCTYCPARNIIVLKEAMKCSCLTAVCVSHSHHRLWKRKRINKGYENAEVNMSCSAGLQTPSSRHCYESCCPDLAKELQLSLQGTDKRHTVLLTSVERSCKSRCLYILL